MDLDDLKKRAKDLFAELTEPRPEHDDRATRGADDRAVDDRAVDDPAARTDRLDRPVDRADRPVADRADPLAEDRPGEPVSDLPPGPRHREQPVDERWDDPAAGRAAPAGERWAEPAAERAAAPTDERRAGAPADVRWEEPAAERRAEPMSDRHDEPVVGRRGEPVSEWRDEPGTRVAADRGELAGPRPSSEPVDRSGRAGSAISPTDADDLPTDPERMVTQERADSFTVRWDEVKGEFVDAPRQAVAKADALVGELLDELGALFAQQRRSIERDFARDEVSTEELRVALRRYRSFFDRLLSV